MYNGIGITTPRGTGTSGYVQRNAAALSSSKQKTWNDYRQEVKVEKIRSKHPSIIEHERLRAIEQKVDEERKRLEAKGLSEEEVKRQISLFRTGLQDQLKEQQDLEARGEAAPTKTLDNFRNAFGVRSEYKEGGAFDREAQQNAKLERIARLEQQKAEEAKEKYEFILQQQAAEKAQKKAERREKKAAKKAAKKAKREEKKRKRAEADNKGEPAAKRRRRSRSSSSSSSSSSSE